MEYFSRYTAEEIGLNVIKVVSESVLFAAAACFERVSLFKGISNNIFKQEFKGKHMTKLLINLFNGGKLLGSAVKFAKFYLIIDGNEATEGLDIGECFIKFT